MKFLSDYRPQIISLSRIAIGILYWSHGAQKLFGWFGGVGPDGGSVGNLMSLFGLAGIIEFFGGIAIILGLFTPFVAFIIAGEMFFAYLLGHVRGDEGMTWAWWANRGEQAATYAWVFLLYSVLGGGPWSLDRVLGLDGGADDTASSA